MITIALPTGLAIIIAVSVVLFILVTFLCGLSGLFDGHDSMGIGALMIVIFYSALWLVPSLLAWAVWATWWK